MVTFDTDFSKLTAAVLKEVLKINGKSASGNKYDLIDRLKSISKETFVHLDYNSTTSSNNSINEDFVSNCSSSNACTKRKYQEIASFNTQENLFWYVGRMTVINYAY